LTVIGCGAAAKVPGEGIEQYRPDLVVQRLAHQGAGAVQPCLDGLWPHAEKIGGLFDAQPLDHPRHEHRPVDIGKAVGGPFDQLEDLPLRHRPLRIVAGIEREPDDLGLRIFRHCHRSAPFAQTAERLVDDDARQPCGERGVAAERIEMGEGPDIGLLHDILGLAVIAHDAARDPVEPLIVCLDDGAAGVAVARQRPSYELHVA
jgi:hypothetical protein